jgi:hypothetical protein
VDFIKRGDANRRTTEAFGRIWVGNFFKNLLILKRICLPAAVPPPLVITGAGPGLEETLPLIAARRDSLFVLGVSSSLMALEAGGVIPDMVISADGGNWALLHLVEYVRLGARRPPLALCLGAALPSRCEEAPLLPLSDGSLWQTLILKGLGIPFLVLPQRGTVAASALDLALLLTAGTIFLTGLDFSHRDIKSHARPYALDRLEEEAANRLDPLYRRHFFRSSAIAAGGSYGIYASWFRKELTNWPERIYALGKNNPLFAPREGALLQGARGGPARLPFRGVSLPECRENPVKRGLAILREALGEPGAGERLREELGTLLFPGEGEARRRDPGDSFRGKILEELRSLMRHG